MNTFLQCKIDNQQTVPGQTVLGQSMKKPVNACQAAGCIIFQIMQNILPNPTAFEAPKAFHFDYFNPAGQSLLHIAARDCKKNQCIETIISQTKLSIDIEDNERNTPFIESVRADNFGTCYLLKEAGADINHQNCLGDTALILACEDRLQSICSYLISNGANTTLRNNHGISAIAVVASCISNKYTHDSFHMRAQFSLFFFKMISENRYQYAWEVDKHLELRGYSERCRKWISQYYSLVYMESLESYAL